MNTFFAYKRNPEEVIDQAWKKLFLTKSRQRWEMQNEIRILKLNRDFTNFPKGLEVQIPVNYIRRIFIKSNLSQHNHDLLKMVVSEVRSKWNYDLNIIKI